VKSGGETLQRRASLGIFQVNIKPLVRHGGSRQVIGRRELGYRIIDIGLDIFRGRIGPLGWGPGFDIPQPKMLEDLSASGGSFL